MHLSRNQKYKISDVAQTHYSVGLQKILASEFASQLIQSLEARELSAENAREEPIE